MAGVLKKIGPQAMTATDAGDILASSTLVRRLKQIHIVNTAASPATINVGLGASLTAATALVFGQAVAANTDFQRTFYPAIQWQSLAIRAFASATTCTLTLVYEEDVI